MKTWGIQRRSTVRGTKVLFVLLLAAISAPRALGDRNQTDVNIKFFQSRISRDPDDFSNYQRLGAAYLQKGRETGDLSYYEFAEKASAKAVELAPAQQLTPPRLQLASVLFAEHRFQESLRLSKRALEEDPGVVEGNAVLGDAYLETGDYDRAGECYAKLQRADGQRSPSLDYLRESRKANFSFIRGDPVGAIDHIKVAVTAAALANLPKENQAWSYFTLGEFYLQSGELELAWTAAEKSAALFPGYHRALALLAQVRAAEHRYTEAAALYQKAMAAVPLPAYAAALGDVYTKLGRTEDAKKQFDLVETVARLNALGKTVYNRELAMFYADHNRNLAQALTLGKNELEVRHDVYTWDAVAWTMYKNGDFAGAVLAVEHALAAGTKDALVDFHAGMIYRENGNNRLSERFLKQSLAINSDFHVFYADLARQTLVKINKTPTLAGRDQ